MTEINFPYRFEGFPFIPEEKASIFFKQILSYANLSPFWLLEHYTKIFKGLLYSIAANDQEFIKEYTNEELANAIFDGINRVKTKNYSVT